MKSWWKKREQENLENQKLLKKKEKEDLHKKIKLDKITQKEKEKKVNEDLQKKIKNNYEQKKKNIKETEKEIIIGKENKRMEKLLEKRNNKEKLTKLKEEKEKEREMLLNNKNYHNNKNNDNKNNNKKILTHNKSDNNFKTNKNNLNKLRGRNTKNKNKKNNNINNNESLNTSIITQDEQEIIKQNFETRNKLIEKYQNNSNIYRCLKCKLIPNIIINEFNQEIESFCDDSYNDISHHNITTYSNFQVLSLNHPIDNSNILCYYCNKVINDLSSGETIYYCSLCNIYFCTRDEEIHKNQNHKNYENLKEKYLELSKNNIKIISNKKNNTLNNNNSSKNKKSKILNKQSSTPALKKNSNKEQNNKKNTNTNINKSKKENEDINKDNSLININNNSIILPDKIKEKKKNKNYNKVQIYLIDSYCNIHNEIYKSYCFNCHKNICENCEDIHINHNLIDLEDNFVDDEELLEKKNELNKSKEELMKINDYFSALIEAIKCKFERLFNIKKKELEIKEKIIQDYETIKYNYQCINNIRNIKFNNNKSYIDKSKNTDWFHRFNLIFKYLNSDLNINNNDIFDILNNRNEKNNIKIISSNNDINTNININKLIILKNDDLAISTQNGNIIIYDKDNLKEKINIKISGNNSGINDFFEKEGGGIICCGYEYIKCINLSLNNINYNITNQFDINEANINFNSIIELNNNLFITSNNNEKLELWQKGNNIKKYKCINCYNYNKNNITEDYNLLVKIKDNCFILSSFKKSNLSMFIINNYNKIELQKTQENIKIVKGNNSLIKFPYEDYLLLSCYEFDENNEILNEVNNNDNIYNNFKGDFAIAILDINNFNIFGKIKNNNSYIDIGYYFNNIIIALDKEGIIHKIEFDKYQQKLFYLDEIKLNNNFCLNNDIIKGINFSNNKKNLYLKLNNKIIKISGYE